MLFKSRQEFSVGVVETTLGIESAKHVGNDVVDELQSMVTSLVMAGVIPACSKLAPTPQEDTTTVSQTMKYTAHGHTVTVEVSLTVRKAGQEFELSHIIAHELTELHLLPVLLEGLIKPGRRGARNSGFSDALDLLGGFLGLGGLGVDLGMGKESNPLSDLLGMRNNGHAHSSRFTDFPHERF